MEILEHIQFCAAYLTAYTYNGFQLRLKVSAIVQKKKLDMGGLIS